VAYVERSVVDDSHQVSRLGAQQSVEVCVRSSNRDARGSISIRNSWPLNRGTYVERSVVDDGHHVSRLGAQQSVLV